MKRTKFLIFLLYVSTIIALNESCKTEKTCPEIICNTGAMNEETCACDCPIGYSGANCERLDSSEVQFLLGHFTPMELVTGGIPLDSLYGKIYFNGYLFYLDTLDGTGLVAAIEENRNRVEWGCEGTNIIGLDDVAAHPGPGPFPVIGTRIGDGAQNTTSILASCTTENTAAKLCREIGADWFLPSYGELSIMYDNLPFTEKFSFFGEHYWCSTETNNDFAWMMSIYTGYFISAWKDSEISFRAVKAF